MSIFHRKIFVTGALTTELVKIRIEEKRKFENKQISNEGIDNLPTYDAVFHLDQLLISQDSKTDANVVQTKEVGGQD